jgi:signal transduction histidine kinase
MSWLYLKSAKVVTILGAFIVSSAVIFDYILIGTKDIYFFIAIRAIETLIFIIGFLFTLNKKYSNYGSVISMIMYIMVGLGTSIIVHKVGYSKPYYAMLILMYIGVMITPLEFSKTIAINLAIFSFYFFPVLLFHLKDLDLLNLVNNSGFLLETLTMASVFSYFQFERIKRDILSRLTIAKQSKEIEEKSEELSKSYDDLIKTEEAKKEFIANITHDLKTPLSVIMGHSELLYSDVQPETSLWRCSKFINKSSMQLSKMIDRLVSIALLDNKEDNLNLEFYDYAVSINDFFSIFAEQASKSKITYKLETLKEKTVVQIDISWLERIFGNLIQNAFKFTDPGGTITISVTQDDNFVYTEVKDTGIGIPADKIEHIFERKYQAHEISKIKGYGLGLNIVKETLKKFGGDITVVSEPGKGSTFRFSLPLYYNQNENVVNAKHDGKERRGPDRRGTAQDRRARAERRSDERLKNIKDDIEREIEIDAFKIDLSQYENKSPSKPTILIVDDTPGQVNLIIETIRENYNMVFADNGVTGLEKLEKYKDKITLILSDVSMPEMDGIEFCKRVFEQSRYEHIPFIFITAYFNEEDELKVLKLGAADYIQKPITANILKEKINSWITRRQNEVILKNLYMSLENQVMKMNQDVELLSNFEDFKVENLKLILDEALAQSEFFFNKTVPKITFKIEDKINSDINIHCNKKLLTQVIKSIIRADLESIFSKKTVSSGKLLILIEKEGDKKLKIVISDNGRGYDEDELNSLFKFKYATRRSGAEIELYLAKMIVAMHGGRITVESKEGKGAFFYLYLPFSV